VSLGDVRFWPKADMDHCTAHVRFWGKCGQDLLRMSAFVVAMRCKADLTFLHCMSPLLTQSGLP